MNYSREFVELGKTIHERTSFDCGEVELNEFIRKYAAKHMEAGVSSTMVLPASDPLPDGKYPICAFYTIAPSSITRESLPESRRKKLPQYPVPVFLIAQMAVNAECQEQELGKITLVKALEHLWNINRHLRAYAVIVDCLNENVEAFYLKYGFEAMGQSAGRKRMFLPMKTVGMLFQ